MRGGKFTALYAACLRCRPACGAARQLGDLRYVRARLHQKAPRSVQAQYPALSCGRARVRQALCAHHAAAFLRHGGGAALCAGLPAAGGYAGILRLDGGGMADGGDPCQIFRQGRRVFAGGGAPARDAQPRHPQGVRELPPHAGAEGASSRHAGGMSQKRMTFCDEFRQKH